VKSCLPVEEIYDVIEAAHLAAGHGRSRQTENGNCKEIRPCNN
jgi:hypothetical protein